MNLIDSSGWAHYFMNGPLAEYYAELVGDPKELVTPTVVLYEVYKIIKREFDEEKALLASSQIEKTLLVPLSQTIAYRAADFSLEYKMSMADAIIYATADLHGAQIITSDKDFKGLPKVTYISPTEEKPD
ncbi:MAG: hypothetical protein A3C47_02490 [Omnitrophica bacterium RIFCSPHIGHO2_02_FULL_51_18]|nr:MAG: hypothetical protein A3C47_02490 [Omnitrophica bacterium RIFCSPHIGHO2_02_FULL_51_18]